MNRNKEGCKRNVYSLLKYKKWAILGLNQGPPDYESVALTN